jgi:hypothetical protein
MQICAPAHIDASTFLIRTGLAFNKSISVVMPVLKSSKSVSGFVKTLAF